jgi:hypothetical protein
MGFQNIIKALEGDESLLLVLPKEVAIDLDILDQDWLKFDVIKNRGIFIKKIEYGD